MKTLLLKLIIILAIASIVSSTQENINAEQNKEIVKFPFERKIWTYWNSDKNEIPLIVKVCLDNLESVAKKHNFTFVCLNDQNVRNYITNYDEEFVEVRKKSIQNDFAHIADLLRMIVLEQQGGIWVDSTTIFLNGLTELENIMSQKYAHMITNRFSTEPDALLFYYSMGQNRIEEKIINPRNSSQVILYNEMPNYEIWFIATKKQSPVIKDMKKSYVEFTTTSFDEVQKRFRDEEIFINRIDDFGHYLYLNMAVAYTLQKKQAELDKSLSLLAERKSVHDEYKLWGLHSEYGPMIMIREDLISLDSIFLYSQEELKAMGWNFIFFMKQFGYFRYYMGWYLDNLIAAFKDFNGSLNDWLQAKPDAQYCENLTLIVKDSILHKMLEQSTVINETKGLRIFTKDELKKWNEYCSHHSTLMTRIQKFFKNSFFHTLTLKLFMYDKVEKAKVHEILAEGQKLSLIDWIKIKYQDNSFLLFDSGYFLIVALLMFWVYKKLVDKFSKMLENYKEENSSTDSHSNLSKKPSSSNRFSILKTVSELNNTESPETKSKQTFLSFLIFVLLFSSLIMYNAVDVTGGREQPLTIFFFIIFTFLIESYIEKETKHTGNKDRKYLVKTRYEYEFFYLFVNYITTYMGLVYIRRNRYWLNWCSLVIGCIGPCVLKMAREISYKYENEYDNEGKKYKTKGKSFTLGTNKIRLLIVLALAIITFVPNVRFVSINEGYIIQYLPLVPLAYLGMLSLYVAYKVVVEKYWLELMRLIIIAIVILQMCLMTERIGFIIHLALRMMFVFRTVVILQAVYLQVGTSISIKNLHEFKFMKSFLSQVMIFICPFVIEFLFGRFYWNIEKISFLYYDYSEQLVIYGFSAFLVVMFTELEKNNQYQSIENIELNQIEHTEIS